MNRVIKQISLLLIVGLTLSSVMGIVTCKAEDISGGVYINEIKTNESKILTTTELDELTDIYEGKILTMSEIEGIVTGINKLYISKGYITARAILPAQKITNNILEIQLIEGSIGEIVLDGNKDTRDSYILKRISFKPGDLINIDTLEKDLFRFNASNDLRLKAELMAGESFGTTDLIVKVTEPKKTQLSLFCDNTGRGETGLYRYGLNILNRSLFGYRDSLNLVLFGADGMAAGSMSYSMPLDKAGTRLSLTYNNNATDIISGDYETVNIEGDYEDYGVGLSRPLIIKKGLKIDGSLEYNQKVSDTYFSGVNLLTTDIETYSFGLSTQSIKEGIAWNSSFNILMGSANSGKDEYSDPGTSNEFKKYNIYLENQRLLKDRTIFTFKSYLQLSNDKLLPSSEQFSLGGMSTVRGYKEGKLIGDQGYFLSLELSKPVSNNINYFVFLDHGGVFPYKGNDEDITNDDYLMGIGNGFTINFTENISGKFVLGVPFKGEEKPRIHFALQKVW